MPSVILVHYYTLSTLRAYIWSSPSKKKKRAYGRRLISRHLLTAENILFIRKFLKIDVLKCVWVMIHFTERVFSDL